jgi:hypothetical protein
VAVEEHFKPVLGIHFEMELALGADVEIFFEVFAEGDGAAIFTLGPQTFGADAALFRRSRLIDRLFITLKPSHFAFFFLCRHAYTPLAGVG